MFGVMAALALSDGDANADISVPVTRQPQPIVIVVHTGEGAPAGALPPQAANTSSPVGAAEVVDTAQAAPVELRAQPVVRTVEVQAPPSAAQPVSRSNGSR